MSHATRREDHRLSWGVGKLFMSAFMHKGGDHCGSGFTEGDNVCWICQGVRSALPPPSGQESAEWLLAAGRRDLGCAIFEGVRVDECRDGWKWEGHLSLL